MAVVDRLDLLDRRMPEHGAQRAAVRDDQHALAGVRRGDPLHLRRARARPSRRCVSASPHSAVALRACGKRSSISASVSPYHVPTSAPAGRGSRPHRRPCGSATISAVSCARRGRSSRRRRSAPRELLCERRGPARGRSRSAACRSGPGPRRSRFQSVSPCLASRIVVIPGYASADGSRPPRPRVPRHRLDRAASASRPRGCSRRGRPGRHVRPPRRARGRRGAATSTADLRAAGRARARRRRGRRRRSAGSTASSTTSASRARRASRRFPTTSGTRTGS